ncbi:MAG: hypothetical protein WCK07_03110 [Betaproteobacteria bacterium]|jgi:hypothetical protein
MTAKQVVAGAWPTPVLDREKLIKAMLINALMGGLRGGGNLCSGSLATIQKSIVSVMALEWKVFVRNR